MHVLCAKDSRLYHSGKKKKVKLGCIVFTAYYFIEEFKKTGVGSILQRKLVTLSESQFPVTRIFNFQLIREAPKQILTFQQ